MLRKLTQGTAAKAIQRSPMLLQCAQQQPRTIEQRLVELGRQRRWLAGHLLLPIERQRQSFDQALAGCARVAVEAEQRLSQLDLVDTLRTAVTFDPRGEQQRHFVELALVLAQQAREVEVVFGPRDQLRERGIAIGRERKRLPETSRRCLRERILGGSSNEQGQDGARYDRGSHGHRGLQQRVCAAATTLPCGTSCAAAKGSGTVVLQRRRWNVVPFESMRHDESGFANERAPKAHRAIFPDQFEPPSTPCCVVTGAPSLGRHGTT